LRPETLEINAAISAQLYPFLQDHAVVFVGYGGNDESILKFFMKCPVPPLSHPIFWVNEKEPPEAFSAWLHGRHAVRVDHSDFDQFMHLIRGALNIELLDEKRWNRIGQIYLEDFVRLTREIEETSEKSKDAPALRSATETAQKSAANDWRNFYIESAKVEKINPDLAEELLISGLKLYPENSNLHIRYAQFLENVRRDFGRAGSHYEQARSIDSKSPQKIAMYARFLARRANKYDEAETLYRRLIELDPKNPEWITHFAFFLWKHKKDYDLSEVYYKRALEHNPNDHSIYTNYESFLRLIRKDLDAAEYYIKRGAEGGAAVALAYYANFLWGERRNIELAKDYYRRTLESSPNFADALGNYAQLLLGEGHIGEGLIILNRALGEIIYGSDELRVELPIYLYAHDSAQSDSALSLLKTAFGEGIRTNNWSFEITLQRAVKDGHPNLPLLEDLTKVAAGAIGSESLSKYPEWRQL
jgi:tetratricopeptide (TPR) repeat protein